MLSAPVDVETVFDLNEGRNLYRDRRRFGSGSRGERDIQQELVLAGGREAVEERPRLDRAVGDRVVLVGARLRLEDVVDAVVVGVNPGEERRPGRSGVRGDGGAQDLALALVDQRLEVGQGYLGRARPERPRGDGGSGVVGHASGRSARGARMLEAAAASTRSSLYASAGWLRTPSTRHSSSCRPRNAST